MILVYGYLILLFPQKHFKCNSDFLIFLHCLRCKARDSLNPLQLVMTAKVLNIDRLPLQYRSLVEFHDALEKIYCFMVKRKMTVTVSKIDKVYKELVGSINGHAQVDILDSMCDLSSHCPEAYKLRLCDSAQPASGCDLEFSFSLFPSATNMHAQKRRAHLLSKLSEVTIRQFASWLERDGATFASQLIKAVNTDGWPASFDLNNIGNNTVTGELLDLKNCYRQKLVCPEPPTDDQNTGFGTIDADHSSTSSSSANIVTSTSLEDSGGAESVLDYLKCQPFYKDQIKHVERVPARQARYGVLAPPAIPEQLQDRLQEALGLQQLYLHQAKAIDALRAGKHTVVSTSTASGKSVIYNIPVLEAVLQDPQVTALYLFPTKVPYVTCLLDCFCMQW